MNTLKAKNAHGTVETTRALANLAGIASKAFDIGTLAGRLKYVERDLKQRGTGRNS